MGEGEERPSANTCIAEPAAAPRQLTPVQNPGAASATVMGALSRLPSARTIVMRAGPTAVSGGITKFTCPHPAEAQLIPAGREMPAASVTWIEILPRVKGSRGPLAAESRSAITGP
jgi:hypothetical protein